MEHDALFSLLRAVEGQGVPTRFPHPSHLWRTLLDKQWQAALCTAPQFAIAPTTLVPVAAILHDAEAAAATALDALRRLEVLAGAPGDQDARDSLQRRPTAAVAVDADGAAAAGDAATADTATAGAIKPRPDGAVEEPEGVAKLGYSWEGLDVRVFGPGRAPLSKALQTLATQAGFYGECVLVQRYVPARVVPRRAPPSAAPARACGACARGAYRSAGQAGSSVARRPPHGFAFRVSRVAGHLRDAPLRGGRDSAPQLLVQVRVHQRTRSLR